MSQPILGLCTKQPVLRGEHRVFWKCAVRINCVPRSASFFDSGKLMWRRCWKTLPWRLGGELEAVIFSVGVPVEKGDFANKHGDLLEKLKVSMALRCSCCCGSGLHPNLHCTHTMTLEKGRKYLCQLCRGQYTSGGKLSLKLKRPCKVRGGWPCRCVLFVKKKC